jgi:serine/threonine protein kinase
VGDDPLGPTITSPDSAPAPGATRSGQRVGHYLIGEPLGEGGMGVVYRASDEKLGRAVAIKFLHRADDQSRARFLREARAASALDHPNIGTVYEVGDAEGAPFIVMALYEGETLRTRIRRGRLAESEIVSIAKQLCSALQAAHAAGIIHRDLKPANVMLLHDGTLKLLDFGLAKLTSVDESSLTREGAILGTLAYMAPEQLKSGEVDARADLWALGAVLYEMLSGEPPFGTGPAATIVTRILTDTPAPARGAPRDLSAVALRLLSKDPSQRLSGAASVAQLLVERRAPRRRLRPRSPIFVAFVIVLMVVAFAVGVLFFSGRPPTTQELMQQEAQKNHRDHIQRAGAYFSLGEYAKAAVEFEIAYAETNDPSELYNVARAHHLAGHTALAIDFYHKFLDSKPAHPEDVQRWLAELVPSPSPSPSEPAVVAKSPSEDLAAEKKRLLAQRAQLEKRLKEIDSADMHLLPGTQGDDTKKRARKLYENALRQFNLGRIAEAAAEFDQVYELIGDPNILFNAAQAYRLAGERDKARLRYQSYLRRLDPGSPVRATVEERIREVTPSPAPATK